MQEWNEQKLPKVLPGVEEGCQEKALNKQVRRRGGKKTRMEKEEPVMKSLKKWLRVLSRTQARMMMPRATAQRKVGQSVKQNWDCSQIENEEEGGRGRLAKGKPDGSAMKWEESLEIRRMEGKSQGEEVQKKRK